MRRRLVAMGVVVALAAAGCTDGEDTTAEGPVPTTATPAPGTPAASEAAGLIPEQEWRDQQDTYLAFATDGEIDPGSPLSLLAHVESANRGGTEVDLSAATVDTFEPIFSKLKAFEDTGDFDVNRLLTLYLRARDQLNIDLAEAIEERLLAFKYWWTEPTPAGVVDSQYYWTENHQIIFLANEYVAGQTFPDTTFTNSGMTGEDHMAHAEERLRQWITARARFGFSEWLSNVYWTEDMKGLLLLAEFADDDELARLASMALDLLFVELAAHLQNGTFGATHGRSYQKDKLNGVDEDTYSVAKLAFDQTPGAYEKADSATLLAVAGRYRPPEVARRIAASPDTGVFRTRSGLPLDPHAEIDPEVEAPYGLTFAGEEGLMTWWSMGAQFPWQVAPLSAATVKEYDLFATSNFQQAASLAPVVETADDETIRNLARSLATQVNPGLLSQVDTYTWRSPGVMLSTAQDWRPGQRGEQNHIWQATLDADALVFTQHPRTGVPSAEEPNRREGYWTGDGAMPRSAQYENVGISIYAPQYDGSDGGSGEGAYSFSYEPYTHAFFPTEHFDEVVEQDGWVIGRKADGYVALWSHRPTEWREYGPDEFTRDLTERFDLVAPGGPDNVWITEVADASAYEEEDDPFAAFVADITGAAVSVLPGPTYGDGALVTYDSPSQGLVTFGWTPKTEDPLPPLVVDGSPVELHPEEFRWDAPYASADWDRQTYVARYDGASLELDFTRGTRRTTR